MSKSILNYKGFSKMFEGGAAIQSSRRIREDEFEETLSDIKERLFPILGIDPLEYAKEYVVIGSIGKKSSPDDTSGDLDIGYDGIWYSKKEGIGYKQCSESIYNKLKEEVEPILQFEPEIKLMKGLNITSIGWPIKGDPKIGIVQLDLIPLSSMKWADFIYYSPDYKISESNYKSAHRNWLLAAILAVRKVPLEFDETGEILDYDTPVLILSDGLFWHTKSFRGKLKARLKNPQKIQGSERFITNDPDEFIEFCLGKGHGQADVKTFEDVLKIIKDPAFDLHDKLPEIKERYIEFLTRADLPIPGEINQIK